MSVALEDWRGPSAWALDEIELLHQLVEDVWGNDTDLAHQITYLYATLIFVHFQRYCRGVHTEASDALVSSVPNAAFVRAVRALLVDRRLLDRGNPTPGNLSRDFARFGFRIWADLEADDQGNRGRKEKLAQLCQWRNAITHGDIFRKLAAGHLVPAELDLATCRDWRHALGVLVTSLDRVLATRCGILGCPEPW